MQTLSTFNGTSASALAPYLRLMLNSSNKLTTAGADDIALGVNPQRCQAADVACTVNTLNTGCILRFVAAVAIAVGDDVYGAASGKVSTVPSQDYLGVATSAASGDGGQVDVAIRRAANLDIVTAKTASFTVAANQSGTIFTNTGASGAITATLPAATVGLKFGFAVHVAQELRIDPDASEQLPTPATGAPATGGLYLTANADGETIFIECTKAGQWSLVSVVGTWTLEGA